MMASTLLRQLEDFSFDQPGSSLTFAKRLARENGWSVVWAERVIVEYKRFLYLAAVAGHAVTPSAAVDQVWHLHLCYTRSYWQDLCEQILGFALHHGPTRGGLREDEKYADWYQRTLQSYEKHFGEPVPAEIWPSVEERFEPKAERWVDTQRYWVVPKARVASGAAVVGLAVFLVGAEPATQQASIGMVIFLVLVGLVLVAKWGRKGGGRDGSGCEGGWWGGGSTGCGSNDSSGCSSSGCGGGGCGGGGGD